MPISDTAVWCGQSVRVPQLDGEATAVISQCKGPALSSPATCHKLWTLCNDKPK